MRHVVTVGELLDGHVVLDIECLDRVPIPSPALMEKISTRFRRAVESFAGSNGIPWMRSGKDDRKIDVMQPYLSRQAATGRSGVAAVGVAQEFQGMAARMRVGNLHTGCTSYTPGLYAAESKLGANECGLRRYVGGQDGVSDNQSSHGRRGIPRVTAMR